MSNNQQLINTNIPFPMTNEYLSKIIKEDRPNLPEYKFKKLMKEFEKLDKSDWVEGEILYPNLPDNFWNVLDVPFPMTNEFINNVIKEYYPELPVYKVNRLMREFEKMDKTSWKKGEIIFPDDKLPKDFWN